MEEYIKLRSVKRLKPRKKPRGGPRTWWTKPGNPDNTDWLPPKLYEGTGDDLPDPPPPLTAMKIIAAVVQAVQEVLLDYVGDVKRLFRLPILPVGRQVLPPHEHADSKDTVSCESCGTSSPASATGETGLVSTPFGIVRLCVDCAKKWF